MNDIYKITVLLIVVILSYGCSLKDHENHSDLLVDLYEKQNTYYDVYYAGDIDKAEKSLLDLLSLISDYGNRGVFVHPNLVSVYYRLADLCFYKGELDESEQYLNKAVSYYLEQDEIFVSQSDEPRVALRASYEMVDKDDCPVWKTEKGKGLF